MSLILSQNLYFLYNCDTQKISKHILKDFQQNTGPVLLKDIKFKKNKERLGNCHKSEENKEI